jgi:hypothetical protein
VAPRNKLGREGRRVRAVVVHDWHDRDDGVKKVADDCRGKNDVCDGVNDGEE